MKNSILRLVLTAALLPGPVLLPSTQAATATKAGTGTDLNDGASWTGATTPTAADIATWNSLSLGAGLTLGANTNWLGLAASGALSDIDISGAGTLSLGGSGINLSTSTVNLSLANNVALTTNQAWLVSDGKGLTYSGGASGGFPLSVNGLTYWSFLPASAAVVFKNVPIASVTSGGGLMGGGYIGANVLANTYYFNNNGTTATYQMQIFDGTFTKCVKVVLAQSGADVTAYVVYAKYNSGNTLGYNFDNGGTGGTVSTGGAGYGAAITILGVGSTAAYASYLPATPTTVAAFPNTSLATVTGAGGTMGGGSVDFTPAAAAAYFFTNNGTTATYQLQSVNGAYTKCVKVQLTQSGADVLATVLYARYVSGVNLSNNFDVTYNVGGIATSAGAGGYGAASTFIVKGSSTGTVTLSGTNTYTGSTAIGAGRLVVGGAGTLGGGSYAGSIMNFSALTYGSTAAQTLGGVLFGPGSLTKTAASILSLSAANTFTGPTTISQGTINLTGSGTLGSNAITLNDANTGTSNTALTSDRVGVTFGNAITVANQGTGKSVIGSSGGSGNFQTYNGLLTLNKDVTLQAKSTDRTSFDGKITGTGNITIDPAGTANGRVTIGNAGNDFVGNITALASSILQLNAIGCIPDACDITNNGTIKLNIGTVTSETIGGLYGAGTVQIHEGVNGPQTLGVGGAGRSGSFSGTINNGADNGQPLNLIKTGAGTQTFSGALNYTGVTTVTNGVLRLFAPAAFASASVTANAPGVLELTNNTGTWTFGKAVTGSGAFTKSGAGSVILSVAQNYTGPTTISGGKLYANAALNVASTVSVATNATFGGQGSAGTVTVADGGSIEGGYSGAGVLQVTNLTFNGAASLNVTVAADTTPVTASGTFTTGPSLPITVNIQNAPAPAPGTYHIAQWGALAGTAGFVLPTSRSYSLQTNGNYLDLVVSPIANYPIWTGANGSEWSHNTLPSPKNWKLNTDSSETDFLTSDNGWLDDTASLSTLSLVGAVAGGWVTFDNTNLNYNVGGAGSLSGGLAKFGPGAVSFTNEGALTLNGGVSVNAGSLLLANQSGNLFGPIALNGGALTIANPSANTFTSLGLTNATLTFNQPGTQTVASASINGNGTVIKLGGGTLALASAVAATNAGGARVVEGVLKLQGASAFAAPLSVEAGGTLELNGAGWTLPVAAGITLSNSTLLSTVNGSDRINILGPISLLAQSTLQCNHTTAYQIRPRGGVFGNNVTLTIAGNLTGGGPQFYGSQGGFSGAVIVTNVGISIWGGSEFLFANADLTLRASTASGLGLFLGNDTESGTGGNNNIHLKSLSGDANTSVFSDNRQCILTVGDNDGTGSYSGIIRDGAGTSPRVTFVKTGTGTQTLAGANTYTGTTTVSNGVLLVSGSLAAGSAVTVAGGTLGGNGAINGPFTVLAGATLRPGLGGDSTTTLTNNNTLSLGGTSFFVINRTNSQNSSRVTGITTLTCGGTLAVSNAGPALQEGDSFVLLSAANRNGAFAVTDLPPLDAGFAWATADNYGSITVVGTVPPVFTVQPISRTVLLNGSARLTAAALGAPPVTYQWLLNGLPVADATNTLLSLTNVQAIQGGSYAAVASNPYGASTSTVAVLTVAGQNTNLFDGAVWLDKPFAYWRLGETNGAIAYDAIGTNDGTYVNVTLGQPAALPGDPDKAAGFVPASSSRMAAPNASQFNFTGTPFFTMEVWVRFDNFTGYQRIFSNRGGGGYGFGTGGNASTLRFTAYGVLDVDRAIGSNLLTGVYYHLAAVITNGTVQMYLNGQPVGTVAAFGNINNSTAPLWLGMNPTSLAENVAGLIDEAVVYTNALSAAQVLAHYQAAQNALPVISQQPQSLEVTQWQPAAFAVMLSQGSAPISCQWYFSNAAPAATFVPLPGATSLNLSLPITDLTNAGDYYLVASNIVGMVTSVVATLTVTPDADWPNMVSVGSLSGWDVGIVFDKPIHPSNVNNSRFTVLDELGRTLYIFRETLRPDRRSVLLELDRFNNESHHLGPLTNFTVIGEYIYNADIGLFVESTSASGVVLNHALVSQDIGTVGVDPLYAGSAFNGTNANLIEVLVGGSGLTNASDGMHFVYQSWTNDFVATVRVSGLLPTTPGALAGLMARTTLATNSQYLGVFTTPAAINGGAGVYRTLARPATNTNGVVISQTAQLPFPDSWLKLRRAGNTFYTAYSSNGTDWVAFTNATPSPATLLLGLATTAGTNSAADYSRAIYADFTIATPVVITDQPDPLTVTEGNPASFAVVATGTVLPLLYQWQRNGADLLDATNASLNFTAISWSDEAAYRVRVSNAEGSLLSDEVQLTVLATNLPAITQDPPSRTVYVGGLARFAVATTGSLHLSYQWFHNDAPLAEGTNNPLLLSGVTTGQGGSYYVVITNEVGGATSAVATLTVLTPAANSYASAVLADAPGAYWRLNEANGPIAYDSFGLNNSGYSNAVTFGVPGALVGEADTAVFFDGLNTNKADVPYAPALNGTNFTAECWARVTGGAGSYRSPLTSRDDLPQRGFIFYAANNNLWEFWSGKGDQTGWHTLSGPAVVLSNWVHLVGTYDGTTKRFYVNGQLVSEAVTPYAPNSSRPLRIGGGSTDLVTGNFFFPGDVDEVTVYGTALNSNRVTMHYLAGRHEGLVSGQVALEAFVGSSRTVTFAAANSILTNRTTQTLSFSDGVASYSVVVPLSADRLSAKTAWNLRQTLGAPSFVNNLATLNFTDADMLPAGDINGSNPATANQVDLDDYYQLAASWYLPDAASDIDGNGLVDLDDYFLLSNRWNKPGDPE